MLEAFAAALLLGGINTIADYVALEFKLQAKPIYIFARVALICYCVGAIVGARARQLMMGMVGGVMIGALVSASYYLLSPTVGFAALVVAWVLFWLGFSSMEALLHGGISLTLALLQGAGAAALSGGFFYAISNIWIDPRSSEPELWQVLVTWTAAFLPGFVVLFWRKL